MRAVGDSDPHHEKCRGTVQKGTGISLLDRKGNTANFLQASQPGFMADVSSWWDWEGDKKGRYQKLEGLIFMAEKHLQLKRYI